MSPMHPADIVGDSVGIAIPVSRRKIAKAEKSGDAEVVQGLRPWWLVNVDTEIGDIDAAVRRTAYRSYSVEGDTELIQHVGTKDVGLVDQSILGQDVRAAESADDIAGIKIGSILKTI